MRNWRSALFPIALALIAVEICFVVVWYVRDGQSGAVPPPDRRVAFASPAPFVEDSIAPEISAATRTPVPSLKPTHAPLVAAAPAPSAAPTQGPSAAPTQAPSATPTASPTARPSPKPPVVVADSSAFRYEGSWQHIAGKNDGRLGGKSSRSFARGARATLSFRGRYVRLYGILGPGGGFGAVRLDDAPGGVVDFFSASKATHRLVYTSPMLSPGLHRVTLAVIPDPKIAGARTQYVNIDSAEYGS